jgi:hypothetical protein
MVLDCHDSRWKQELENFTNHLFRERGIDWQQYVKYIIPGEWLVPVQAASICRLRLYGGKKAAERGV